MSFLNRHNFHSYDAVQSIAMMKIAITKERTHTAQEYLALEIAAETRNEYRNGEIIPITGGITNHHDIGGNLFVAYLSIPSFQEYLLVSQYSVSIELC